MAVKTAKRIAASILGIGINRIRLNPAKLKEVSEALTREDVRALIKTGAITRLAEFGVSRGPARERQRQRAKGRQRGTGKRAGLASARSGKRDMWIAGLRAQRAYILEMLEGGKINHETYKKVYYMAKGGFFSRGRSQVLAYLKDNKLLLK